LCKKGSPVKTTRKIVTIDPRVKDGALFETGKCMFTFHSTVDTNGAHADQENVEQGGRRRRPTPVGALSIKRSLFPARLVSIRESDLLSVNPVFLLPADRHVTVLMPESAEAFRGLDHFVVELTNADSGNKLACIAIHKHVFAGLLMINSTVITFHNVVITPRVSISMRMYVSRIRKSSSASRIYVNIDRIEFSVPDGFEKVYFPSRPTADDGSFAVDTEIAAWQMVYAPVKLK
jgi:hypothetical protein